VRTWIPPRLWDDLVSDTATVRFAIAPERNPFGRFVVSPGVSLFSLPDRASEVALVSALAVDDEPAAVAFVLHGLAH